MFGMAYNTFVVLVGTSLLGAVSGLVGSFTVLRRRALIGDALSHAALPGLCVAFLVVQRRSLPALLFGALLSGVLGVFIVAALRKTTRVKEDAAIGIVLSVFYGAGIVLISVIQSSFGNSSGLKDYVLGDTASMVRQDVYFIIGVCVLCAVMIVVLYKELKVVSFDPGFAEVQGWPVLWIDLGLMIMVALTVVVGLPAVGAIMMAALMIIPAAAARFWTNRLSVMLWLSGLFGLLTGSIGTFFTARFVFPAGPSIVLVGSAIFILSLLLAPKRGVIAQSMRLREFRLRVIDQRLVAELLEDGGTSDPTSLLKERSWSTEQFDKATERLMSSGLLTSTGQEVSLTDSGRTYAQKVVRAMSLWKLFLIEHPQLASSFTDLDADTIDETLPREVVSELEEKLKARTAEANNA